MDLYAAQSRSFGEQQSQQQAVNSTAGSSVASEREALEGGGVGLHTSLANVNGQVTESGSSMNPATPLNTSARSINEHGEASPIQELVPLRHKRSRLTTVASQTDLATSYASSSTGFQPIDPSVEADGTAQVSSEGVEVVDVMEIDGEKKKPASKFNIYAAIINNEGLLIEFAARLPMPELISLYAIDQVFHFYFNLRYTTFVMESARNWAPESMRVFPFHQYSTQTIFDPARRENEQRPGIIRDVPSLCWLQMVAHRERVVTEIIGLLAAAGHQFPPSMSMTIKKIWSLMTFPNNALRIGIIHNPDVWSDDDLELALMFFIKLDMRFSNPNYGAGSSALRKMLLGQRSLILLWKALRREALTNRIDILREWAAYSYEPPADRPELAGYTLLGMPPEEVGALKWEGWGMHGREVKLLRPEQVVFGELVRRRIDFENRYVEYMLYPNIHGNGEEAERPQPAKNKGKAIQSKKRKAGEDKGNDAPHTGGAGPSSAA